jgi:WD40 repeat protein
MPILARCTCGKSFQAKEALAGKRVKCPACGSVFVVPSPSPAAVNAADDPLGLGDLGATDPSWDVGKLSPSTLGPNPSRSQPAAPGKRQTSERGGLSTPAVLLICGVVGGVLLLLMVLLLASLFLVRTRVAATATTPAVEVADTQAVTSPPAAVPQQNPPAPRASAPSTEAPTPPATWSVTVDPPSSQPPWPDRPQLEISVPTRCDRIVYPATPSPFALTGLNITGGDTVQVWNLVTGEMTGQLQEQVQSGSDVALSPDGRHLAVKAPGGTHYSKLQIWSFETGRLAREIECDDKRVHLQAAQFVAPELLVAHTSGSTGSGTRHRVGIWNVTAGTLVRTFDLTASFQADRLAVSPGGRYLATMASNNTLSIYGLESGSMLGQARLDSLMTGSLGAYRGMSFSPDGRQLGIVLSETNSRLVLLDVASGTVAEQLEIAGKPPTASAYRGAAVEWLADRGWCLFGGTVIDRGTRRVVWNLDLPIMYRLTARRTVPGGWIALTGPYSQKRVRFLPIPWEQITAGLTGMQADAPALLKPGGAISLEIRVGQLRAGTADDTQTRLIAVFHERFSADGISVADDQSVVLHARYSESEGETLHERQGILGPPTGRTVQATKIEVAMELCEAASGRVLWSHTINYDPHSVTIRNQEVNEATARDSIFHMLLYKLSETPIPYYISQQDTAALLPGVTAVTDDGTFGK